MGEITSRFDRQLIWRSVDSTATYSVTLLRNGLTVLRFDGLSDTTAVVPDSIAVDPAVGYSWFVEARRPGGPVLRSPVQTFTLR
jgi:hypothetical protein